MDQTAKSSTTQRSPGAAPPGQSTAGLGKRAAIASWLLQAIVAVILAQTLFFKFTAAPESVHIFTTLGVEPWGRIGVGVAELVAVVLILTPPTAPLGALATLGLMVGAIASHLGPLGVEVQGDGGALFALALTATVCSAGVLILRRQAALERLRAILQRKKTAGRT